MPSGRGGGGAFLLALAVAFAAAVGAGILAARRGAPAGGPAASGGGGGASGAAPARIVSLAPSITEVLFAVGAGPRVVAATSFCDFPPEAAALPKVGGYNTPNVELVLGAKPDLVLVAKEGAMLGAYERLRGLGLRVEPVAVASLDDLGPAIERVAALAGEGDAGRALAARIAGRVEAVRRAVAERPRVRALLAVDHDPLIAAARGTFGDDLLGAAGGENVAAAGALSAYPQLGAETLLAAAPDAIVDAAMAPGSAEERAARARAYWGRWPDLPAVRAGKILLLPPEVVVRPGPRLVDGLERLARWLHPEAF